MSANRWNESTYYEILEIDPQASGRDVHAAYTRAKDTYSPESPALYTMFTQEEARELLKMIDEAFAVLSNQSKRHEYNLRLAQEGHPAFASLAKKAPVSSYQPAAVQIKPQDAPKTASATLTMSTVPAEEGAVLKTRVFNTSRDDLPEGFGRTRFGVFEINPQFEKEISTTQECGGSFFLKIRQYKKVSLDQISEATRISKSYLSALESDAKESLPAPVFVRGFALQYVRILGAPDKLADAYMKNFRKQIG